MHAYGCSYGCKDTPQLLIDVFFFSSCRYALTQHGETKRNDKQSDRIGRCKEIPCLLFMPLMVNIAHVANRHIPEGRSYLFQ